MNNDRPETIAGFVGAFEETEIPGVHLLRIGGPEFVGDDAALAFVRFVRRFHDPALLIDLSRVARLDAAIRRAFARAASESRVSLRLVYFGLRPDVAAYIKQGGLDKLLIIVGDYTEALAEVRAAGRVRPC